MNAIWIVEHHISGFIVGHEPLVSTISRVGFLEFLRGVRNHATVQHIDIERRDALFLREGLGAFIKILLDMASERNGVFKVAETTSVDSDVT